MTVYLTSFRTGFELTGEFNRINDLKQALSAEHISCEILTTGFNKLIQKKKAESFFGHLSDIFRLYFAIKKTSKENAIIVLFLPTPSFSIIADLIKITTGHKIIVYFESQIATFKLQTLLKDLKAEFSFYFLRLFFNNRLWCKISFFKCAHYIVSTRFQEDQLIESGCPNHLVSVIPNLVQLPTIEASKKLDYRSILRLSEADQVICYVGHYFHVKGVDLLIKAFIRMKETHPHVKLVLAWSGLGDDNKIKSLIKETGCTDTIFQLNKVKVFDLLKQVNMLALPYRHTYGTQILPNLIMEGMASGVPIITCDSPVFNELKNKGVIMTFQPCNIDDLQNSILHLLDNPADCKNMIQKQEEMMQSDFCKSKIVECYKELFIKAGQDE